MYMYSQSKYSLFSTEIQLDSIVILAFFLLILSRFFDFIIASSIVSTLIYKNNGRDANMIAKLAFRNI